MVNIKVVTDSTCDLPLERYGKYDIGVIPVNIRFGTETFLDGTAFAKGTSIDQATFYSKIEKEGIIPSTSLPSVGQFVEFYQHWADEGYDTILSLHVTGALSGVLNSAQVAAREVENRVRVIPFDSLSGSAALGFMCIDAMEMARAGKTVEEILERLKYVAPRVRVVLTLATLQYAQASGRISNLQNFVASLLSIQPIVILREGKLLLESRYRSRQAAVNRIVELTTAAANDQPVKLAVLHARAQEEARALRARFSNCKCVDSFLGEISLSVTVHFGPGALGTVVYPV